jgi:hypothetical protein
MESKTSLTTTIRTEMDIYVQLKKFSEEKQISISHIVNHGIRLFFQAVERGEIKY